MADSSPADAQQQAAPPISQVEFVFMAALLMASNAMAIDIMLPAMADIGAAFSLATENDRQLVIIAYMLGFGCRSCSTVR